MMFCLEVIKFRQMFYRNCCEKNYGPIFGGFVGFAFN